MQSAEPDIESAYHKLEARRDDLLRRLKMIETAITGLKPLMEESGNGAESRATPVRVASFQRPVPEKIDHAVRDLVKKAHGEFALSQFRQVLRSPPYSLSEDESGFYVSVLMRQLDHEGVIETLQRPMGRRDGLYRPKKQVKPA